MTGNPQTVGEVIELALRHHRAGELAKAQTLYQQALSLVPQHPQALHLLGVVANQLGQPEKAISLFEAVLAQDPRNVVVLNSLGNALRGAGRLEEAAYLCRQALALNPQYAEAHNNLGNALLDAGKSTEAEQSYGSALLCNPRLVEVYANLGKLLLAQRRLAEAEAICRRGLAVNPELVDLHSLLGQILGELGRGTEAEQACAQALTLNPNHADACSNLGFVLAGLGRRAEAEKSFERAVQLKPNSARTHSNLAVVQWMLGKHAVAKRTAERALALDPQLAEANCVLANIVQTLGSLSGAEGLYRRALALKPAYAEAHNNLANTLRKLGRVAEAEKSYRAALAIKPDYAEAHLNLGHALGDLGRAQEAERSYAQARRLTPESIEAQVFWRYQRRHLCEWSEIDGDSEFLERPSVVSSGRVPPFAYLSSPEGTAPRQLASARAFAEAQYRDLLAAPVRSRAGQQPGAKAKLRIGYLSADYYNHPTSHLLVEVIEGHDRGCIEAFGYSYGPQDRSEICRRMRGAFDVFRDIRDASNADAAGQIADDQVDILVDLKGYTTDNRLAIVAHRPAAVQVSWLGYPGTLGDPRLADYIIGDPIVTPLEHAAHYSETLALMPHCYQPNDRQRGIGQRPTREQVGLPPGAFVFCSFNQTYKITKPIFALWCRLLEAVPGSVLWLLAPNDGAASNLAREAVSLGIDPRRIVFAPRWPPQQHLGRLQLADLALDTYPYTSHTTASDCLWVGVPLVTLLGQTFAARVAASILSAADMPELVATSTEGYFSLARAIACSPDKLSELKARLAAGRMTCALFDSVRFARALEALYRQIWDQHCTGARAPISLSTATSLA